MIDPELRAELVAMLREAATPVNRFADVDGLLHALDDLNTAIFLNRNLDGTPHSALEFIPPGIISPHTATPQIYSSNLLTLIRAALQRERGSR